MSEAARIDLVDRAPLTEKQQNVYESIMQYQRVLQVLHKLFYVENIFLMGRHLFLIVRSKKHRTLGFR